MMILNEREFKNYIKKMFSSQEYLDNKEDIDKFFNTIKGKGYRALDKSSKQTLIKNFLTNRTALSKEASAFIFKILNNARMGHGMTTLGDVTRALEEDPPFEDVAIPIIKDKSRQKVANIIKRVGKLNKNTKLKELKKWVDRVLKDFSLYKSIMHELIDAAINNDMKTTGEFVEQFERLLTIHRPQGRV